MHPPFAFVTFPSLTLIFVLFLMRRSHACPRLGLILPRCIEEYNASVNSEYLKVSL